MAKTVCKLLGVAFLLVGIAGIFSHDLLGAHLNMAHNMVHIVSGIIALYFGFSGSYSGARGFCIVFGLVYLLLAVCGWFLGTGPEHMFKVGTLLMLGKMDHILHVVLGVFSWRADCSAAGTAKAAYLASTKSYQRCGSGQHGLIGEWVSLNRNALES